MLAVYAVPIGRYRAKYRFLLRRNGLARPEAIAARRAFLESCLAVTAEPPEYRPRPARWLQSREAA